MSFSFVFLGLFLLAKVFRGISYKQQLTEISTSSNTFTMTATVGEIKEIKDNMEIEWRITDFFALSETIYHSPIFHFAGTTWRLRIYPNGNVKNETVGNVDCYLLLDDSSRSVTLTYELGLKKVNGNIDNECSYTETFDEKAGYGCRGLVSRSELLSRVSELAPSNILTIICKLRINEPFTVPSK